VDARNKQMQRQVTKTRTGRNKYNLEEDSELKNEQSLSYDGEEKRGEKRKREKSEDDRFEEIIKKSKTHRNEKKRDMLDTLHLKEDINDDFDAISSFLTFQKKEKKEDEYDQILKSFEKDGTTIQGYKKKEEESNIDITPVDNKFDSTISKGKIKKILNLTFKNQREFEVLFSKILNEFFNPLNDKKVLNNLYEKIYDLIASNDSEENLYFVKSEIKNKLEECFNRLEENDDVYPVKSDLYFIKLILSIFRIQNENFITTCCLIYLHKILINSTTKSNEDVISGIFICNLIFEILNSKSEQFKFSPEIIFWFEKNLKENKDENIVKEMLKILKSFTNLYSNLVNYSELFQGISENLKLFKKEKKLISEILSEIEKNSKFQIENRKPIQYLLKKPIELQQFEPLIYSDYGGEIIDKRRNSRNFEKKVKREERSTVRELRKDNLVLRKTRDEQQNRIDKEKKLKFNKIMKEIEHEKHQQSKKDFSMRREKKDIKEMRKNRKK
jgi:hypothetical protein